MTPIDTSSPRAWLDFQPILLKGWLHPEEGRFWWPLDRLRTIGFDYLDRVVSSSSSSPNSPSGSHRRRRPQHWHLVSRLALNFYISLGLQYPRVVAWRSSCWLLDCVRGSQCQQSAALIMIIHYYWRRIPSGWIDRWWMFYPRPSLLRIPVWI